MKTALVTGSEGFIARHVIRYLKDDGYHVIGVDKREKQSDLTDEYYQGNTADPATFASLAEHRPNLVFHLGTPSSVIHFKPDLRDSFLETVAAQINVMQYCSDTKPKLLIFPSTSAVYAGVTETSHHENVYPQPRNPYGAAKMSCEGIAQQSSFSDWIALRIFAGYGEGEERKGKVASPIFHFLGNYLRNEPPVIWGDGEQSRDFVHIFDIVRTLDSAIRNDYRGLLNIGTGVATTFNHVCDHIASTLESQIYPEYVDKPINYVERLVCDRRVMDRLVDWDFLTVQQGIARFVEYLQAPGNAGNSSSP